VVLTKRKKLQGEHAQGKGERYINSLASGKGQIGLAFKSKSALRFVEERKELTKGGGEKHRENSEKKTTQCIKI